MDRKILADRIAADILRPDRKRSFPTCFICGREFTPKRDVAGRFCSLRCIELHDAGCPPHSDAPSAASFINVDTSRWKQIAGPPIPKCEACGGLCVERFRSATNGTGNYCSWRCRDGKPKDCQVCGKNLYASGRRGPFCSDACAQNRKAQKARKALG